MDTRLQHRLWIITSIMCGYVWLYFIHLRPWLKCTVCLTNGATVGCYVPTCQNVYHFCCLYGTPPPSLSLTDNNGKCKRHDDY